MKLEFRNRNTYYSNDIGPPFWLAEDFVLSFERDFTEGIPNP